MNLRLIRRLWWWGVVVVGSAGRILPAKLLCIIVFFFYSQLLVGTIFSNFLYQQGNNTKSRKSIFDLKNDNFIKVATCVLTILGV